MQKKVVPIQERQKINLGILLCVWFISLLQRDKNALFWFEKEKNNKKSLKSFR